MISSFPQPGLIFKLLRIQATDSLKSGDSQLLMRTHRDGSMRIAEIHSGRFE